MFADISLLQVFHGWLSKSHLSYSTWSGLEPDDNEVEKHIDKSATRLATPLFLALPTPRPTSSSAGCAGTGHPRSILYVVHVH